MGSDSLEVQWSSRVASRLAHTTTSVTLDRVPGEAPPGNTHVTGHGFRVLWPVTEEPLPPPGQPCLPTGPLGNAAGFQDTATPLGKPVGLLWWVANMQQQVLLWGPCAGVKGLATWHPLTISPRVILMNLSVMLTSQLWIHPIGPHLCSSTQLTGSTPHRWTWLGPPSPVTFLKIHYSGTLLALVNTHPPLGGVSQFPFAQGIATQHGPPRKVCSLLYWGRLPGPWICTSWWHIVRNSLPLLASPS